MVVVLAVLVLASLAGVGLSLMEIESLRDRVSRLPQAQHSTFNVTGAYPHIRVIPEGWDMTEPQNIPDPFRKPEKKK